MARFVTPRDGMILGIIDNAVRMHRGIDWYFIYNEQLKLGKLEMDAEGTKIVEEWDKANDRKRKRKDYVQRNIQYLASQVAQRELPSSILVNYVKKYGK